MITIYSEVFAAKYDDNIHENDQQENAEDVSYVDMEDVVMMVIYLEALKWSSVNSQFNNGCVKEEDRKLFERARNNMTSPPMPILS